MYQKYCAAEELRSKAQDTHGLRVWRENGVCADQVISATKKEAGWWLKCMKPTLGQLRDGLAISMINSGIFHRFSPAALHKLKLQNRDQNSLAKQKPLLKISKQTLSGLTQKLFPSTIALESFRGEIPKCFEMPGI